MRSFIGFLRKTHGLTTIEWVCICAVVMLAALGITTAVMGGAQQLGGAVAHQMEHTADDIED